MKRRKKRRDWNDWLESAKSYHEEFGDLLVPSRYITPDGYKLGRWIERQRAIYNGNTKIRIRKLIVPRIDRLGRTLLGTLQFIQDYIVQKETARSTSTINNNRYLIEFISCQERFLKIVTNDMGVIEPASQLVLTMFSCFAEFDRNQIVGKLKDGRLKRVAAGYPLGGGNKPYGYEYVKDKDGYGNYEVILLFVLLQGNYI